MILGTLQVSKNCGSGMGVDEGDGDGRHKRELAPMGVGQGDAGDVRSYISSFANAAAFSATYGQVEDDIPSGDDRMQRGELTDSL